MTTPSIGRIVVGCLTAGVLVALALVVGPVAGAQEHVITGTVLLAFAASWALLATLSILRTDQPQRWAADARGLHGVGWRRSHPVRSERRRPRDARVGVAAAPACARRCGRASRPPGSAQSYTRLGCVPAAGCLRAQRPWRGLSNRRRVFRRPHASGTRRVGGRWRTPASSAMRGIGYADRHPRIRPWRDCGVLGMDLDGGRTRHEGVRLRPRGSRLERSGFCPAGRDRRGHGPPHPARSRARDGSVRARRPFVGRAVRADLRRPVSRTGRRNGLARRPTGRSVRGSSNLSGVLQRFPPRLCAAAVPCSTWRGATALPCRL